MFVRLTYIEVAPENVKEVKESFMSKIVPVVKEQKGCTDVMLLEPTDPSEKFVSLTKWKTKSDADAYEASGTYRKLVDMLKSFYTSKPVLKTYNAEETNVPAM